MWDQLFNPLHPVQESPKVPWLLVWDLASVHTSDATRRRIKDELPHIAVTYVAGNATSYSQPLDTTLMRPFKAALSKIATSTMARLLLDDASAKDLDLNVAFKRASIGPWVSATLQSFMDRPDVAMKAWGTSTPRP